MNMKEILFEKRGIHYQFNDFSHGRLTLVFIHGLSGSSSAWISFVSKFTKEYNLLMVDLRGHGRSLKPKRYRDYSIKQLADDIDELIEHLGIEHFTLISHSFGTLVTLEYLLDRPHKARAAVFLSPNYGIHRTLRARLSWPLLAVATQIIDLFPSRSSIGTHLDYTYYFGTGDWNIRRMLADIRNTTARVYVYCLEHTYRFNRDSWWEKIRTPTLIVHGKKDSVIPAASAKKMAEKIKGSTLVLLDDADHTLVLNWTDETIPFVVEFLTT